MKLSKLFPLVLLGLTPVFAACSDQASANGAVAANADVASANASMAGMQSELVMEFAEKDLGNVFQQHSYDLEFPFEVVGSEPIVITEIDTSCGCTKAGIRPDWDPDFEGDLWPMNREIPAGAKGTVVAIFDANRYERVKASTITLRGTFAAGVQVLNVTAYVKRIFDLEPDQVRFADLQIAQLDQAEVHREIKVTGMEPFEVLRWKRITPGLLVEELGDGETLTDGRMTRTFRVTATTNLPEGRLSSSLIAETSLGIDLEFLVNGKVLGAIQYAPAQSLSFGIFDQGQARTRTVKLESSGLLIPEPQIELLGDANKVMTGKLVETQAGKLYEIKINISDTAPAGSYNGILRITFPEASGLQRKEIVLRARIR
jgi:hypothetical protein